MTAEEWKSENREATQKALTHVFRPLLANLLLDIHNPKYREVRKENKAVQKNSAGLSPAFVDFLFQSIGFNGNAKEGHYVFQGDDKTLANGDKVLSEIENSWKQPVTLAVPSKLDQLRKAQQRERAELMRRPLTRDDTDDLLKVDLKATVFCPEDFESVKDIKEKVRLTLLNTGRIRNCLFDAKDFTVRRMVHGRVCACAEHCGNDCLEAHWHLLSGKGTMYAFVAHISPDGATCLHLGAEYGYQYNSIPGGELFGKTTLFSIKLIDKSGNLAINDHPNRVCESCIYCATPFAKLLF